jgi:hypothetical protein
MNPYYIQGMMRQAQQLLLELSAAPELTIEDRREQADASYTSAVQDEIDRLDRLIQLLEAGLEFAEKNNE